jgi:HlyD family secretion protein
MVHIEWSSPLYRLLHYCAALTTDYGGFKGTVRGTVEHLGLQIGWKTLQETTATNSEPTFDQEARVVEVRIRIVAADSTKVAGFTNMLVAVKIDTRANP